MQRQSIRAAIHIAAVFAIYLSVAMLVPAAVDLYVGNKDWQVFAFCGFFMCALSMAVALATQSQRPPVSARFGFLVVNMLWLTLGLAGAVPFYASSLDLDLADAVFEATSAITTTGGTVIVGLDEAPPGLLLWRSLLQWMGGLGVIALGLFVLPFLNIGGISYFRIESSVDVENRPFARFSTYTLGLISVYAALTMVCAFCYAAAGMSGFDAVNHALTTISTAGFSTHDASFGYFGDNWGILWTGTIFMFIGALPFSIMVLLVLRGRVDAIFDPQIKVFAGYTLVLILIVAIYTRISNGVSFSDAITHSAFNIVSVVTTTGYASQDYTIWGPLAVSTFFVATFLGGCSGSSAGGIKAYRFLILYSLVTNGLRRLVYPNSVQRVRYGDRPVPDEIQRAVVLFIASFFVLWAVITILLSATGLDYVTASTGAVTSLTNVGPGLGEIIGPAGNYSTVPDAAKWILSVAMLLGRLEILAVLVLFTPAFWGR